MRLSSPLLALATVAYTASMTNEISNGMIFISKSESSSPIDSKIIFSPFTEFKFASSRAGLGGHGTNKSQKPIRPNAFVLWHGLGDKYDSDGIQESAEIIKSVVPGAFVHSIYLDKDPSKDERLSMVGRANDQVAYVCAQLANITELSNGFSAFGFSQGGLFLRAIVEHCPNVTISKLITFGSPHMGVLELPLCSNDDDWICKRRNEFLKRQVWNRQIQNTIVPAQYFRDPAHYDKYLEYSQFLADLNNERPESLSDLARERFSKLEKLVLIKFSEDSTLVPKESAFFEEIDPVTDTIVPFDKTNLFKKNSIGLKSLHENGKIDFYTVADVHMRFLKEFFSHIVETYFA